MGGLFSFFKSYEETQNTNSNIFIEIKSIYVQRHAVSCANTIEKVFGKGQIAKTKYATNSNISYVGVQQCLQVSDYFSKNPIESENFANNTIPVISMTNIPGTPKNVANNNQGIPRNVANNNISQSGGNNDSKKPLLIFCCSELLRTQQTLFLSWIRYLKDYREKNGKIIVLPWMNEVSAPKIGSIIINKDNYPTSFDKTKESWSIFIQNLTFVLSNDIEADTLNPDSTLVEDINAIQGNQNWEKLFYLSSVIYNDQATNQLRNNGKKIPIRRKGILKKMSDMNQFIGVFGKILNKYIEDQQINLEDYNGIELVIVAHHNSAEHFMEFVMPSTHDQFKEIQLVNCEVVKLPGKCLYNFITQKQTEEPMVRVFPMNFNTDKSIFNKELSIIIDDKEVYPLFILYISALDLFLSINNIVKTRLKVKGIRDKVQIKKPIYLFLKTSIFNYRIQLGRIKKYIETIQEDYKNKSGITYYNYAEMIKRIGQKNSDINQYMIYRKTSNTRIPRNFFQKMPIRDFIENKINNNEKNKLVFANMKSRKISLESNEIYAKLRKYLFGMCELNQEIIDSIAVF